MPKLKIHREHGVVPNQLLNDENVSLRAKGLYAYIQSKPNDWNFSATRIATNHNETMYVIKKTLRELENLRYLIRKRYQKEDGRRDWEYILHPAPLVEYPPTVIPPSDIPPSDIPTADKPPILVKKINKKRISKKEIDIVSNDTISEPSSLNQELDDFFPGQDEIIQAPPPTPSPRGDHEINRCLEIIKSHNEGTINGAKGENRQYAKHLIRKLQELPKVVSGEYSRENTLDTLLGLVAKSPHHRHKIGGAKSIFHNIASLIQVAKGEVSSSNHKVIDLSAYAVE